MLNAADYGVPQARPRLFIVGARKREKLPSCQKPTHHGQWERRKTKGGPLPHVTTGEALAGLVTEPEPEEVVRGQMGSSAPRDPAWRQLPALHRTSVAIPNRSSSGGLATGRSC